MLNIKFNPTELETINDYQDKMQYDKLLDILSSGGITPKTLNELNDYLKSVNELVEFTPVFNRASNHFKFNQDLHLLSVRTLKIELERLTSTYEDYLKSDDTNHNDQLYRFLVEATPNLIRGTRATEIVFVNFDGCNGNQPRPDAKPTIGIGEWFIIDNVIDAIFNHSFKNDKDTEWAKVACEYQLREELDIQKEEVEKRLEKLTDFKRHGVDSDSAVKLILYSDMAEKKTNKKGEEYWCIYLPEYTKADKAWVNVKLDAVSEAPSDKNMIELFLVKDDKSNIHYQKDGKHKIKEASNNKDIIPPLKKISDEYLKWKEDSLHPTFAKKLAVLEVGQDNEDFVIAINDGEHYISIHFEENEIQGSLYDGNFHHDDAHSIAIEETTDTLEVIGKIFDRLSPTNAKASALAKCDQEIFLAKVAENKKISDYKLIAAIDEMSANDDKRSDLARAMARKVI